MDEIKILRLKTGEDIIGFVKEDSYGTCFVIDAMIIDLREDLKSQQQILTLSNWAPSSIIKVNESKIFENDILTKFTPTDEFSDYYIGTLKNLLEMKKQKEAADNMTDEEIMTMIEALDEREINTLH